MGQDGSAKPANTTQGPRPVTSSPVMAVHVDPRRAARLQSCSTLRIPAWPQSSSLLNSSRSARLCTSSFVVIAGCRCTPPLHKSAPETRVQRTIKSSTPTPGAQHPIDVSGLGCPRLVRSFFRCGNNQAHPSLPATVPCGPSCRHSLDQPSAIDSRKPGSTWVWSG